MKSLTLFLALLISTSSATANATDLSISDFGQLISAKIKNVEDRKIVTQWVSDLVVLVQSDGDDARSVAVEVLKAMNASLSPKISNLGDIENLLTQELSNSLRVGVEPGIVAEMRMRFHLQALPMTVGVLNLESEYQYVRTGLDCLGVEFANRYLPMIRSESLKAYVHTKEMSEFNPDRVVVRMSACRSWI